MTKLSYYQTAVGNLFKNPDFIIKLKIKSK